MERAKKGKREKIKFFFPIDAFSGFCYRSFAEGEKPLGEKKNKNKNEKRKKK